MNQIIKQIVGSFIIIILLNSCGLFGIHIHVHNPRIAGRYSKVSKEKAMLGELNSLRKSYDVTFYGLDIFLDPDKKEINGWVEIKTTVINQLDTLLLDLDQPLKIDEIRLDSREGKLLNYSRKYRNVYVKLPSSATSGTSFSVHVKYHGKPIIARKPPWSGGLVWKKDKQKHPWCGVACEAEGASVWLPCKDHTSDEPDSAKMRFTISDTSLMVVSNGIYTGSENHSNSKSFNWKVSYPINLYNITFYLGNFQKIEDSYTGINGKVLNITHYVLKPNALIAEKHFKRVKNHLRVYEELYGEYCWYKDGFKLVESPYKGMEHQSAIAYGNGYRNDLNGLDDYIMLHETGHEWFGNAISVADLADVWLQEGVTTYGEYLYLEKEQTEFAAKSHLLFYRLTIKNKRPVVGPVNRRYFNYKDGDVYVKGAWTLHTLRNQINNDSIFLQIMRTFYEENKLKTTDSKTFISTVNRVTGKNYNWLLDQYLYERKVPFIQYEVVDGKTLYYRWVAVKDDFNQLTVPFKMPGAVDKTRITPSVLVQKLEMPEGTKLDKHFRFDNSEALFGMKKNKKLSKIYRKESKPKN